LNHPLYAILNYAKASRNVLMEEGLPNLDSLREWNQEIAAIASSAGEAVKRLRSFARRAEGPLTACRIEEIVAEAVRLVDVEMRRERVTVETFYTDTVPPIQVDRVQIQQILVNLLTNAVEAMQATPPEERQIAIRTSLCGEAIEVAVSDRGAGLPSDTQIFEPYVTTKADGVGMGLSIVRTIVDAHGGRLWAQPNPDGGATFHFTLPMAKKVEVGAENAGTRTCETD
jgi:two-component system, LuxR family, sensor kinase FixL